MERGYGVAVSPCTTWVIPGVTSELRLATDLYEPGVSAEASYVKVTVPPPVGGLVLTLHSVSSAGAARFSPLVPVRFSAPELPPEPGSGEPLLAAPYVSVTSSLAGVVPILNHISNVWVVALLILDVVVVDHDPG
jgi:hypothetical protein